MAGGSVLTKTGIACFQVPLRLRICVCTHLPDCELMSCCVFISSVCVTLASMSTLLLFSHMALTWLFPQPSLKLHPKFFATQRLFGHFWHKFIVRSVNAVTAMWSFSLSVILKYAEMPLLLQHFRNTAFQYTTHTHTHIYNLFNPVQISGIKL